LNIIHQEDVRIERIGINMNADQLVEDRRRHFKNDNTSYNNE